MWRKGGGKVGEERTVVEGGGVSAETDKGGAMSRENGARGREQERTRLRLADGRKHKLEKNQTYAVSLHPRTSISNCVSVSRFIFCTPVLPPLCKVSLASLPSSTHYLIYLHARSLHPISLHPHTISSTFTPGFPIIYSFIHTPIHPPSRQVSPPSLPSSTRQFIHFSRQVSPPSLPSSAHQFIHL